MGIDQVLLVLMLVVGGIFAIWGIFRPHIGLLVLIAIHFMQPGELVPALDVIHLEKTYSIAMLAVFIIGRLSTPGRSLLSNKVVLGSFLLLGCAALSIPLAVWMGGAAGATVDLAKNIVLLVLIYGLLDTGPKVKLALWTLVGVGVWFSVSALYSYAHGDVSQQEGIARAMGMNSMVGGPNELAGLLLALLPFLITLVRTSRNIIARLLLLVSGASSLAALVLTGARASMVALMLMGAYYVIRSKHKVAWLLVCFTLAGFMWAAMPQEYRHRYLTVEKYASGHQLDASNELRLQIWNIGWRMFLDHPIIGVGAGQFSTAYGTLYATRLHQAWMNPHNLFIEVACELGIIGLGVFSYFVLQIIKQILHLPRRDLSPQIDFNYQVASACGGMLIALIAVSLVSHTLFRPYWYFLGGLVAANYFSAWAEARKVTQPEHKTPDKQEPVGQFNEDNLVLWSRSG
jgi:O-antigen ligase